MQKVHVTQQEFDIIKQAVHSKIDLVENLVEILEEAYDQLTIEELKERIDIVDEKIDLLFENNILIQVNVHTNSQCFVRLNILRERLREVYKNKM